MTGHPYESTGRLTVVMVGTVVNYVSGWALYIMGFCSAAAIVYAHDHGSLGWWFAGFLLASVVAIYARSENRS